MLQIIGEIGADESVAALVGLLEAEDPIIRDQARQALQRIPGETSDQALLASLKKEGAEPNWHLGIIGSLSSRKSAAAVPELAKILELPNPDLAAAAALALGTIGGTEAKNAR